MAALDSIRSLETLESPQAGIQVPRFMQMTRGEFRAIDLSVISPEERVEYLMMRTRMVRDRNEPPEAEEYFDGIEEAFMTSFSTITPAVLADPSKLNFVKCVDKYADAQLEKLQVPDEEQTRLPGGLGWFDITGTMVDWVVPRVWNEEVVAGMHRNCGGFAIKGALYAGDQAMYRERAEVNAKRMFLETAAIMGQYFLRKMGRHFDPEVADVLSNWGGPHLIISTDKSGTAEPFVTPKAVQQIDVEEHFTPREVIDGVEGVINRMMVERSD